MWGMYTKNNWKGFLWMERRVIKICFVFSLIVTMFTSSLSFANIDSHLKDLDLEGTRVILRALNNKFKVDWISVKSNHPKRMEETQKVLSCLTFILDEKVKKIVSLSAKQREMFGVPRFNQLLNDWYLRKTNTCNEIKEKLKGECENSYSGDLYTFEWLRPFPDESADPITDDFVMVDEERLISCEIYFPPKPRNELEDMISTSSVTSPMPVVRSSMSRIPSESSKKSLSSRKSSKPIVSSLPEVGSSSMSVKRPSGSSKKSLKSSRKSSKSIVNPLPFVGSSLTSTDIEEDSERLRLQQDVQDREELLLKLDEKGAKIALQAILNNYLIPPQRFDFNNESDKDGYQHIHNYLNCILQNKKTKVEYKKEKPSNTDAESAAFASYWHEQKRLEYEGRLEIIWELFKQVSQPQVN